MSASIALCLGVSPLIESFYWLRFRLVFFSHRSAKPTDSSVIQTLRWIERCNFYFGVSPVHILCKYPLTKPENCFDPASEV